MESFSLVARIHSVQDALRGIRVMLRPQHNAWVHAVATVVVVIAGFALQISPGQWLAIILAVMAVWTSEALNTAFESLCDVASPEFHPLVEQRLTSNVYRSPLTAQRPMANVQRSTPNVEAQRRSAAGGLNAQV